MALMWWCVWCLLLCTTLDSVSSFCEDDQTTTNSQHGAVSLYYSRATLLGLRPTGTSPPTTLDLPREIMKDEDRKKNKKRGSRGGVRARFRRRPTRPPLPSIVFGNVKSLRNKMSEISGLTRYSSAYREACILSFSETWLKESMPDSLVTLDGFHLIRSDRTEDSEKKGGGGVCLFINDKWCMNTKVHDRVCIPDIDLLSVTLRPFYLPREFTNIIVCSVYIHPAANATVAADTIAESVERLQTKYPNAPVLIMGDFNHCRLDRALPSLYQHVTCVTREQRTIDLCYSSVQDGFTSRNMPRLGRSDHNMVQMLPVYRQKIKSEPKIKKTIKVWSPEVEETLKDCFDITDWDVLTNGESSLDIKTEVVTDYINWCKDVVVPEKTVTFYPNTKPWITKDIKSVLREKEKAFSAKDKNRLDELSRELDRQVENAKQEYKEKVEEQYRNMNLKDAFRNLKKMAGSEEKKTISQAMLPDASELNKFYARFDIDDRSDECQQLLATIPPPLAGEINIPVADVASELKKLKPHKASGPDGITGRVLRACAEELAPAFQPIYQESLDSGHVPTLWKSSTIIPVPKKARPTELNHYRPVALTPLPMKCLEKLVLGRLLPLVQDDLDPLQFAYRHGRGVNDAIATLLHSVLKHLESPGCYARILFIDYSSAFNTIQRHQMIKKLISFKLPSPLIYWTHSFLSERPQRVKAGKVLSPVLLTNTGAPQGCCASPMLYSLYTNDLRSDNDNDMLVKFADDTAVVALLDSNIYSPDDYQTTVKTVEDWCSDNFLLLNAEKTKELVIDFRTKNADVTCPLKICGKEVEIVDSFRYLGLTIDKKLTFDNHIKNVSKSCQSRLYILRQLRSFRIDKNILKVSYETQIESLLTYCCICFYGNLSLKNKNTLIRIANMASKIIGQAVNSLDKVLDKMITRKAHAIARDPSHPLNQQLELLPSNRRYRTLTCKRNRYKNSFLPKAVHALNKRL